MNLVNDQKKWNPDLLVNIFTKERERIDVNQFNAGWDMD
jgi:hypothetical protein